MIKTRWTKVLGLLSLPLIAIALAVIVFTWGSGSDTNTTEAATSGAAMSIAVDPLDAVTCPPEKVSGETCVAINSAFDVILTADAIPADYVLAQAWIEYGATGLVFTNSFATWPDISAVTFATTGTATGTHVAGLTALIPPLPPSNHKGSIYTFSFSCTSTPSSHTLVLEPSGGPNAGTFGALFGDGTSQFIPTTGSNLLVNCVDVPRPSDDVIRSMGQFQIEIEERFRPIMAGYPGYDSGSFLLTSPKLVDRHTVIGVSAYHLDGDATDAGGAIVGSAGTMISDSDFSLVPAFEGPAGSREVHTEIRSMNLKAGAVAVRAGTDAPDQPISPGEVESKDPTGASDFPADSFFNVFVEVDLPAMAAFDGGTLFNSDPLLVQNTSITVLPPKVVYIHGNSNGVPMYFKNGNGLIWQAGDLFGWLVLAGHGAGFDGNDDDDDDDFNDAIKPITPVPPVKQADPGDTDNDGCSDERENGPNESLGGQRDWLNRNDFYDAAGSPGPPQNGAPDGVIDLPNDILGVIQHHPAGPLGYDVQFDRGPWSGPNSWNETQGPDGVIDLPNDILGVILQFAHRCI